MSKNHKKKTDVPIEGGQEAASEETKDAGEKETGSDTEDVRASEDIEITDASPETGEESLTEGEENDPRDEKIAELNDKNLRLMAEFENFRKRTDREKEQMFENGAKSVIEKVLPVIDNFERALDMTAGEDQENKEDDPFMDGMRKVYKQLMDELNKIGVKPIEAVGKEFDPEFHNAVMQVDSEEYDSGIVASEMQKGYLYNDSVVRHSMVGVAK